MLPLNIFNDFCTWWYFWWIGPFVLGLALGAVLWRRFKARVEQFEQVKLSYSSTITGLETALSKQKQVTKRCLHDLATSQHQQNLKKDSGQYENKIKNRKKDKGLKKENRSKAFEVETKKSTMLKKPAAVIDSNTTIQLTGDASFDQLKSTSLQVIEGIGPKLESILKDNGISTWEALSTKTEVELRQMLQSQGSRYSIINPSTWPIQASKASNGDWEGLIECQSDDNNEAKCYRVLKKIRS